MINAPVLPRSIRSRPSRSGVPGATLAKVCRRWVSLPGLLSDRLLAATDPPRSLVVRKDQALSLSAPRKRSRSAHGQPRSATNRCPYASRPPLLEWTERTERDSKVGRLTNDHAVGNQAWLRRDHGVGVAKPGRLREPAFDTRHPADLAGQTDLADGHQPWEDRRVGR